MHQRHQDRSQVHKRCSVHHQPTFSPSSPTLQAAVSRSSGKSANSPSDSVSDSDSSFVTSLTGASAATLIPLISDCCLDLLLINVVGSTLQRRHFVSNRLLQHAHNGTVSFRWVPKKLRSLIEETDEAINGVNRPEATAATPFHGTPFIIMLSGAIQSCWCEVILQLRSRRSATRHSHHSELLTNLNAICRSHESNSCNENS